MTKPRMLALLVVGAHWAVAIWHLFLAAKVLPAPNNNVSSLALALISLGHLVVSLALWKLGDILSALVGVIFFLAALGADLFEHFLHPSLNNIFTVTSGDWTAVFKTSVFILLALEILGCSLGIWLLGGRTGNRQARFANHSALP